ncbi:MAG: hypothetical protein IJP48_12055 [Synergistaceae bacterium]|nr:hypothetical protein [Synergistaceae bacterium]
MLLSRYILDARAFNDKDEERGLYWSSCSICKWLNNDFAAQAFNDNEKKQLYTPNDIVLCSEILWIITKEDISSRDIGERVFLLSHKDIAKYFPGDSEIDCPGASAQATAYAETKNFSGSWWLRSSSTRNPIAYIVSPEDKISYALIKPEVLNGIRPAIWIKL